MTGRIGLSLPKTGTTAVALSLQGEASLTGASHPSITNLLGIPLY